MKAKLAQRPSARLAVQPRRAAERRPRETRPPGVDLHLIAGGLDAGGVLRLQAAAGNQAVGQLLAQRSEAAGVRPLLSVQAQAVDCPPAPPPLVPRSPQDDPRFQVVTGRVGREAGKLKAHPPGRAKVAEAERGAAGPSNEVRSQAARAQVDQMSQQKPKGFDKAAFSAAVHAAIDRATPKTMEEVDDFTKSGKPGQLKEQVVGQVGQSKDAAGKGIKDTTAAAPDLSKGSPKPVTPMRPEAPGPRPRDVGAAEATPLPLTPEQVSLQQGKCETSNQLAEAEVTQEQVDESNEPQFQDAMAAKKEADQHADTAPGQLREEEQATLAAAQGEAAHSAATGLSQAHHSRVSALGHVGSHKNDAKSKNEAERARVAREIEAIYGKTKADVEQTLNDLDGKVSKAFDDGEKAARDAFEGYYKTKKDEYFDDRYSGFWGWKRWASDKLFGPPARVNEFIVEAKNLYVSQMGQVIDRVATIVETELNRATARIQQGRDQIKEYVAQQPKNLRRVAQEAGKQFASQFDELDQAVNDKSGSLVEGLAQQYVAAAKKVDERCEEMREENKGLIDKVKDKIAGIINAIKQMKELLSQIADRAASVAGQIIRHPIRFLENLVDAVKQGFDQFTTHIETHLKEGVISWLFGEVAKAGITLPSDFDLKGILTLIAQILGLGWDAIRARAVAILGPKVVGLIERGEAGVEKAVEIFNIIKNEGLGGVVHLMADKVDEIKEQALDFIKGMVITEVITAGVKWVLSLFNPVAAFIKACKAIYDIVMFFVNHAKEIVDLVNTILDNLAAIVAGNIAAAAKLVEDSLAKAIPLVIGFLASLLGLGDFGAKIRGVIDKVRQPVTQAVDWVLAKVVKPMVGFVGKGAAWAGGKAKSGADWLKGKGRAGVTAAKEKLGGKLFGRGDERTPEQKKANLDRALELAYGRLLRPDATLPKIRSGLPGIRKQHGLKSLEAVVESDQSGFQQVHIEGEINPKGKSPSGKVSSSRKRGDHVFATGLAKAFEAMRQQSENMLGSSYEGRQLTKAINRALSILGQKVYSLTVNKGAVPEESEMHSHRFGHMSSRLTLAMTSYIHALAGRLSPPRQKGESVEEARRNVEFHHGAVLNAALMVRLYIGEWLDAVVDPEAEALVPERRREIEEGKRGLSTIRESLDELVTKL